MIKDFLFYDKILKPLALFLSKKSTFFDEHILDYSLSNLWLKPLRILKNFLVFTDEFLIRRKCIEGLTEVTKSLSQALQLIQNGQPQFYFAFGLIFMGATIVSFILAK